MYVTATLLNLGTFLDIVYQYIVAALPHGIENTVSDASSVTFMKYSIPLFDGFVNAYKTSKRQHT